MSHEELLLGVGTLVWVPCVTSVWRVVEVTREFKSGCKELHVRSEECVEDEVLIVDNKLRYHLRNPDILIGENDLTSLSYLHEPAVLHNLRHRFARNIIYTYCGIVLVAINPYDELDIYNKETILAYRSAGASGGNVKLLDPHIFAVAEDAYTKMEREGANQSIIVSGESGAGKTVSAKYAMRYFATVGGSSNSQTLEETQVERKVLASNPLMEAIGNAKTTRNDNSSRFGKYVELNFDVRFVITGASMRTYLLEKSRVVFQSSEERNYHIFYQMCRSRADHQELSGLFLEESTQFNYTKSSPACVIDDKKSFIETFEALKLLQFGIDDRRMVFKTLAGILQLGNVSFVSSGGADEATVSKDSVWLQHFGVLLGVDFDLLRKTLTTKEITSGREKIVKNQTSKECAHARDALAKLLYSQLFLWIVENINNALNNQQQKEVLVKMRFIGVLDIYGFETFDTNSFEQFCINYANEKLQQQFNLHVFKLDQDTYVQEGIEWTRIDFYDNQPCIDLIESKLGILDLLDEECRLGNSGSDGSWLLKLHSTCEPKWKHYKRPKLGQDSMFAVQHFADTVTYTAAGFIEKNRDAFSNELVAAILSSKSDFVSNLVKSVAAAAASGASGGVRTSSSSRRTGLATTGSQFMSSLSLLMTSLNTTTPHYVRCIKPNDSKLPFVFENVRAVQQLRACGVLETIRISAAGFPSRWVYGQFLERYRMLLLPQKKKKPLESPRELSVSLLLQLIPDADKYRLGKTRIFFRAGQVAELEKLRLDKLKAAGLVIQKTVRAFAKVKTYMKLKKSAVLLQKFGRGYIARKRAQSLRENKAATLIQKTVRMFMERRRFLNLRRLVTGIQRRGRGFLAREKAVKMRRDRAATVIQSFVRMMIQRRNYREEMRKIILIQSVARRRFAKSRLKGLKLEARSLEHVKQLNKGLENKIIALQQKIEGISKESAQMRVTKGEFDKLKVEVDGWRRQEKENKAIRVEVERLRKKSEEELGAKKKLEEEHVDVVAKKVAVEEELRSVRATVEEMKLKLVEVERENDRLRSAVRSDREHIDRVMRLEEELEREREMRQEEVRKRIGVTPGSAAVEVGDDVKVLRVRVEELESDNKRLRQQNVIIAASTDGDDDSSALKKVLESQNKELGSLEGQVRELRMANSRLKDQLAAASSQQNDSFGNRSFQVNDVVPVPAVRRQTSAAAAAGKHLGMLEYPQSDLNKILRAIIFDLHPSVAVKERPSGLPAYVIFMMIRYTDYLNDDQLVRDLLAGAISFVKRVIRKKSESLDTIVLWLTNVLRLLHTLKQYSGDASFQADNTPTQNEHALKNFDLSEYRQVLSDHAVWIYMLLIKKLEDGIQSLIVPAVLENAGIDVTGGSSSLGTATTCGAKPMENLTAQLDTFFGVLSSYELDFEVVQQVFKQMYYYVCAAALNNLLLRRELCNWQKAIEIRYNVSTLEEWCRRKKLDGSVAETLAPVVQASQLLQARKNEKDVQGLCDICDKLSVQQVVKLLNLYTSKDGYDSDRVSRVLINSVQQRLTEMRSSESSTATTTSLLMDTKYSFSVKFPFNPSAVALETLVVPDAFAINNLVKRL